MSKIILVIGATGLLGAPVARNLKKSGFGVRILARNTEKARKLFDDDFEIVEGNVSDPDRLESALDGCYGVHINLSGEIEQTGTENVVKASVNKGIKKISYISGTSVSEKGLWFPQTRRKFMAEKAIKESGINYSIFCPTWFMESLPKYVKGDKAYVFGKTNVIFHFVAARDYAEMVSKSFLIEEANNKRFFIHGPEGYLFHEAMKKYCSVMHPEIKKVTVMPIWLTKMVAAIKGSPEMKFAAEFMSFFKKTGELGDPAEANTLLGAPKTTLDEWLKNLRNAHQKS